MKDLRLTLLSPSRSAASSSQPSAPGNTSGKPETLRAFITNNPEFYHHACISGIIWPTHEENLEQSLTKYNLRYRLWSIYLHSILFLSTIAIFVIGVVALTIIKTPTRKATMFCQTIGIVIQNAVLYPAVVYLRKNLVTHRDIDPELYSHAFGGSMIIGQRVRWLCMASLVAYSVLVVTSLSSDDSSVGSVLSIIAYFIFLIPTQYFLSGILTFLIMEQRISLHTVRTIISAVDKQTLNRAGYFQARDSILQRDRVTPINILISCAVINFVIGLILLFTFAYAGMKTSELCLYIFYVSVIFGKELVVLVLLLLEIVEVNELCEVFVKNIARNEWGLITDGNEDVKERQRLGLYAAVKEFPVGSVIFYVRPKKFEVTVQLLSMVLSALAAVFWAFTL